MSYRKIALLSALFALILTGCSFGTAQPRSPSGGASKIGKNSPATMRPYKINGKTYYPEQVSVGDTQMGIASWYGPNFHGKYTSNGEIYDMNGMTAPALPQPCASTTAVHSWTGASSILAKRLPT